MNLVRIGRDRYLNLERMTYVEPARKERLIVHFAVGGGDVGGPSCQLVLEGAEADALRRWLDARSENAEATS